MRTAPYPTYSAPPERHYNLHWGPVTGRLHGSLQTEFSDNINLDERNAAADVYFYPNVGIGFQWPISEKNILEFGLGFGYRAYVDHPQLNSIQVSPDSRLTYQMRIGKVNVLFRDAFQIAVDPLTRPDINGGSNGSLLNFQRINNDIGVQADWQARSNLAIVSSYDYVVDRSLNSQFATLDRDDHSLAVGAYSKFGAAWNVGVSASTTITEYQQRVQNDGISYSIGPQVTVKVTKFITLDATVGYTRSQYDQTGTIGDQSDFSGVSFAIGAKHNLNSKVGENLRVSRSITPGFGSNFNELTALQYGLTAKLNSFISVNTTFSYEHLASSGPFGERADRYITYVGTGWQVARRWNLGLAYSFAWKDSDQALRDYRQNRVTIDLTHEF